MGGERNIFLDTSDLDQTLCSDAMFSLGSETGDQVTTYNKRSM